MQTRCDGRDGARNGFAPLVHEAHDRPKQRSLRDAVRLVLVEAIATPDKFPYLARFGNDAHCEMVAENPVRVPGWGATLPISLSDAACVRAIDRWHDLGRSAIGTRNERNWILCCSAARNASFVDASPLKPTSPASSATTLMSVNTRCGLSNVRIVRMHGTSRFLVFRRRIVVGYPGVLLLAIRWLCDQQ